MFSEIWKIIHVLLQCWAQEINTFFKTASIQSMNCSVIYSDYTMKSFMKSQSTIESISTDSLSVFSPQVFEREASRGSGPLCCLCSGEGSESEWVFAAGPGPLLRDWLWPGQPTNTVINTPAVRFTKTLCFRSDKDSHIQIYLQKMSFNYKLKQLVTSSV